MNANSYRQFISSDDRRLLSRTEVSLLSRVLPRIPRAITPDHLTLLGVAGSLGVMLAYWGSSTNPLFLVVANLFLAVNWLADSLDGALARYRQMTRPRLGFYIDFLADMVSVALICTGLAISDYFGKFAGLSILAVYYQAAIVVLLIRQVGGKYNYSFGLIGPTESRAALAVLNSIFLIFGAGARIPVLVCVGILALSVFVIAVRRVLGNLRKLTEHHDSEIVMIPASEHVDKQVQDPSLRRVS